MARGAVLGAALLWALLLNAAALAEQRAGHPLLRPEQRGLRELVRVAAGATCPMGSKLCGGKRCVNPQTDPANCGGCSRACEPGVKCKKGKCQCPRGRTPCEEPDPATGAPTIKCSNLQRDRGHCGKCGTACQDSLGINVPQLCVKGRCVCPKKTTWCKDPEWFPSWMCVDLSSQERHCGKCQNRCADGATCRKGKCVCPRGTKPELCYDPSGPELPPSYICLDVKNDPNNCGVCTNVCPGKCINGTCACNLPGYTQCGPACANLKTDPYHCGSCKANCRPAVTPTDDVWCCDGQCPSRNNCGQCGRKCAANEVCCFSICGPDGLPCHQCADLSSDFANCGQCGNLCFGKGSGNCVKGKCQ